MTVAVTADETPEVAASAVPAIATVGLQKAYGSRVALHGLSLTVQPGEVFGFLGPNGAGKTTAVKILTGLVHASAGSARLFGVDVGDPAARTAVGYLPELFRFQDWLTGAQLLDLHGRLLGLGTQDRRDRAGRVLARVGLEGRGDELIRGYSKGMTQRVGLAQALLGDPRLVLLDEPTSALDPVGRRDVRDLIRELRDEGVTVFLNSHLLSEVEQVCDRVAVMDRGRVVFEGRLDELAAQGPRLRITVDRVDAALLALLARHGDVEAVEGTTAVLQVSELGVAPVVAEAVVRGGWRLAALVPVQESLEDAFLGLVQGGTE